MQRRGEQIIETPVEARAGFLDRPGFNRELRALRDRVVRYWHNQFLMGGSLTVGFMKTSDCSLTLSVRHSSVQLRGSVSAKKAWTEHDDNIVRKFAPKISLQRLAVRLKRSKSAVRSRARALGVETVDAARLTLRERVAFKL